MKILLPVYFLYKNFEDICYAHVVPTRNLQVVFNLIFYVPLLKQIHQYKFCALNLKFILLFEKCCIRTTYKKIARKHIIRSYEYVPKSHAFILIQVYIRDICNVHVVRIRDFKLSRCLIHCASTLKYRLSADVGVFYAKLFYL